MTIDRNNERVQITQLGDADRGRLTPEFQSIVADLDCD